MSVEKFAEAIFDKVDDTVDSIRSKAEDAIDERVRNGSLDASTVKMAEGAAKVGYGLVRGGIAVSAVLGHGLAGFLSRRPNPGAKRMAGSLIKHGFEAAQESIDEGSQIFKEGLKERRNK